MSARDEELMRQIFAMMEYMGYDKYSVRPLYGPFVSFSQGQIYFCSEKRCLMHYEYPGQRLKKYRAKAKEKRWFIENAHANLMAKCREKALQKWVNIELANNGLFWCGHE